MRFYIDKESFIDTNQPLDISMELSNTENNVRAWYVDLPKFEPVRANGFVGSVEEGGGVNFRDIYFNPHGHGTHTECLGHITNQIHSVNDALRRYFFNAIVITIQPTELSLPDGTQDFVIQKKQLESALKNKSTEALIIRTLPNGSDKKTLNYSSTNPPYLELDCIDVIRQSNVDHLLIDLPSVDREEDGGALAFHHAFWEVPENPQFQKTITELIFVDDTIVDGEYILEMQMASFNNDAAPSRPVLYKRIKG